PSRRHCQPPFQLTMASLKRRRFLLLSAVALVGAACGPTGAAGLRGTGTVLYPRTADAVPGEVTVEPTPGVPPVATPPPVPTVVPEPIVASDALPTASVASTDAEMHVVPMLSGRPPI